MNSIRLARFVGAAGMLVLPQLPLLLACHAASGAPCAAPLADTDSVVTVTKPYFRWLFGGFGFQHSEANFLALMPEDFRDQRVLKTFAELSPTFGRVYTGFADQSQEQMNRFADYYDMTFRQAGTTLYAVPCAMPAFANTLDAEEYAEKVARGLEYMIKVRNCSKIRYYCISNELMSGDRGCWFKAAGRDEVFKRLYAALFFAFRRHGLDIKLLASDEPTTNWKRDAVFPFIEWIRDNMNDYVGVYSTHWYVTSRDVSDMRLWGEYNDYFSNLVATAWSCRDKRYILGEYGFKPKPEFRSGVMIQDVNFPIRQPKTEEEAVLCKCEIGLAAMNQGAYACLDWSFVDYPDPFVIEDGDSPAEHAVYEAAKCGYRMDTKYNKFGVFRWCSTDRDYSAYAELYAMGWLVKLFRKDATVLPCAVADPMLRVGAVMNKDQSVSVVLVNRGPAKRVSVDCSSWKTRVDGTPAFHQPLRRYVYEVGHVPYNAFSDLQPMSGTVEANDGLIRVDLPGKSMTFLTTDYVDRTPKAVDGLRIDGGRLFWTAADDAAHRYYRVFKDGKQVASTVATSLPVPGGRPEDFRRFSVKSVDKWNNEGMAGSATSVVARAKGVASRKVLVCASYNIREAMGRYAPYGSCKTNTIGQIARIIRTIDPDWIGLQETVTSAPDDAAQDHARLFPQLTGMYCTFAGAQPHGRGEWGNALLSKEKPLSVREIKFDRVASGPQRCALVAEFAEYVVCCTHLALKESERCDEARRLLKELESVKKPLFLCGDLNSRPGSEPMRILGERFAVLSDVTQHTFPLDKPHKFLDCVDYILVDKAHAYAFPVLRKSVIKELEASDHYPISVICGLRQVQASPE